MIMLIMTMPVLLCVFSNRQRVTTKEETVCLKIVQTNIQLLLGPCVHIMPLINAKGNMRQFQPRKGLIFLVHAIVAIVIIMI